MSKKQRTRKEDYCSMRNKLVSFPKEVKLKDFLKHIKKSTLVDLAIFSNGNSVLRSYGFVGKARDIPCDLLEYRINKVFTAITFRFAFYIDLLEPIAK